MKVPLLLTCLVPLVMPSAAIARPVSYPEGWTAMQMNDRDTNNLHVHYSPTAKYSIGYKAEYWRKEAWQFHGVQLNYLVNRWNRPASQANIYLKSGIGVATGDVDGKHHTEPAAFTGVAMDWEDRRYFTSYENRLYEAGDIDSFFTQTARVGIAPYIGDYGDLHTWLMLQVDHRPESDDPVSFTPLVRMFKNEYLAEVGVSDAGQVSLNFVIRF